MFKATHTNSMRAVKSIKVVLAAIAFVMLMLFLKSWTKTSFNVIQFQALGEEFNSCKKDSEDKLYKSKPKACTSSPLLLVIMVSFPNNFMRRMTVRNHVQSEFFSENYSEGPVWKIIFLLASTSNYHLTHRIEKEKNHFSDILQGNFKDTRDSLVYKVLMGLVWASCNCRPKFLLKCNDDTFFNAKVIAHWLLTNSTHDVTYHGLFTGTKRGSVLHAEDPRQIKEVRQVHLVNFLYQPYLSGHGYLMSIDVLDNILPLIEVSSIYHLDDLYVSTLVRMTGVEPRDDVRFRVNYNYLGKSACSIRKLFICQFSKISEANSLYWLASKSDVCSPRIYV